MDQPCTKKTNGIELCHATVDDGDWAEVVPETVHMLQTYLKTDRFVVLVDESLPEGTVAWIFDAFENAEGHTVDEGCLLELGHYQGIPAALFNDDLTSLYFAQSDEQKVMDVLSGNISAFDKFVSLPESPPQDVVPVLGMFELRIWVPQSNWKIAAKKIQEVFVHHLPIYIGSQDAVWVPADVEKDIYNRLESFFERIAICMFDGKLSKEEARTIAGKHLSSEIPETSNV